MYLKDILMSIPNLRNLCLRGLLRISPIQTFFLLQYAPLIQKLAISGVEVRFPFVVVIVRSISVTNYLDLTFLWVDMLSCSRWSTTVLPGRYKLEASYSVRPLLWWDHRESTLFKSPNIQHNNMVWQEFIGGPEVSLRYPCTLLFRVVIEYPDRQLQSALLEAIIPTCRLPKAPLLFSGYPRSWWGTSRIVNTELDLY